MKFLAVVTPPSIYQYTLLILVFHGDGTYLPLCIMNNYATCIPQRLHIFSCALWKSPTVLHAQWKLLPTLIRYLSVLSSIVSWYHLLVFPGSSFLNIVADWWRFTCCLYLGVTICHFLSYLCIRTCFLVVFTLLGFAVPTSFLDLYGCFC